MITMVLIDVLISVPLWVMSVLPSVTLPTFFQGGTGSGTVGGIMAGYATDFSDWDAWVPFDTIGPALLIVATCLAVSLVIKVIRVVASFLTGGGGSAA